MLSKFLKCHWQLGNITFHWTQHLNLGCGWQEITFHCEFSSQHIVALCVARKLC